MNKFLALALLIGAAAFGGTAIARADPDTTLAHDAALFCRHLDWDATPAGILWAAKDMIDQGVPRDIAIETINYALVSVCPEYQPNVAVTLTLLHGQAI